MAIVPVEPHPNGNEAATVRFERLERVRARQRALRHERFQARRRARRRLRLILLVAVLAGIGLTGFAATQSPALYRFVSSRAAMPVGMVRTPAASPAAIGSAFGSQPQPAIVPPPIRIEEAIPEAAPPPPVQPEAERPRLQPEPERPRSQPETERPRSSGQAAPATSARVAAPGLAAPRSRAQEPRDTGAADPTAAIDWLLRSGPRDSGRASDALLPRREEGR